MKDVINLELSKRLQEQLKDVETEYFYKEGFTDALPIECFELGVRSFKTLTTIEALDFLPMYYPTNVDYYLRIEKDIIKQKPLYRVMYAMCEPCEDMIGYTGKTLLEAIEAMLEHLLNEGLLNK